MRRAALARRDALALDVDAVLEAVEALTERALALPDLAGEGPVAGYWPIRGEMDPRPVLEALSRRGVPTALPAIDAGELVFRAWTPWEPVGPVGFGTLGPLPSAPEVVPRVLLVPVAAFDRACHRLGYGKGFYDRAIARLAATGPLLAVGIAYAAQEVATVPLEDHDRRLDVIVTEREVIRPAA